MQDAPQENPKKLFVGSIPFSTTEETIVNLFSQYGKVVDGVLIVDRMSGRSKGIAFITYDTVEEAEAATKALNGYVLEGREIVVNVARPRVPRDNSGGYNNRRNDSQGNNNRGGGRY
ncbi:MAG: RNA-binding protein [Pseudomonadales bacterium]|nr:RNA-binding protein [Pseudomonadales bacterium]